MQVTGGVFFNYKTKMRGACTLTLVAGKVVYER